MKKAAVSPAAPSAAAPRGRLLGFLSAAALAALLPAAALAANWYVATNGSDSGAGTLAAPFATLMQAQTAAASGDTIYVRGGTYATFAIAFTDSNYNYVHRFSKSGLNWAAYPGETPLFNFASVPTNLRVCAFHVTGSGLTVTGFHVTGVKDGAQKQSECWRIDGASAYVDFYDCVSRDNAANGFYFTTSSRGSCTRCDSYNNIGTNSDSIGNTDGFGAHGLGVTFRYCRAWNNSDDGYDCISSPGANTFDHCWAYNMRAGGDSNGFKVGGFGADPNTVPPVPVPVHTVSYCLAANNAAHGFYANHQPGQAAVWTYNSSYNNSSGNYNMLERTSDMAADISGFREVLHYNIGFTGTIIKNDNNPAENVTDNSWTKPGVTVNAAQFQSTDATQMILPRSAGNNLPFITFMHLTPGSSLEGLGCFQPPPAAPTGLAAAWINSSRVDLTWTASPGATTYYVKRATSPGGPYTTIAARLTATGYSDTAASANTTYHYVVTAMDDISFDESAASALASAVQGPTAAITAVSPDTGRSATDRVTSGTQLTLSGTTGDTAGASAANSSVAISRAGAGVVGTVTADANGAWTFDYTAVTLAAGSYTFTAAATGNGFTGVASAPFVVVVDTAAPAAPVISSAGGTPLAFTGTAEPNSIVAITREGVGAVGSATTDGTGHWSYTSAIELGAESVSFTATATDVAGNTGPASDALSIDSSIAAPVITAISPDRGISGSDRLTNSAALTLHGTATAGIAVNVIRRDAGLVGSTTADGSGNWSFDYTGTELADGSYLFNATASVGESSSLFSPDFPVTIDTVLPVIGSVVRLTPAFQTITPSVTSVVYRVTFAKPVYNVTAATFALTATGDASGTVSSVSAASGTVFDFTVTGLGGEGELRLGPVAASGIIDAAGNEVAAGFPAGQPYVRAAVSLGSGTWIRPATGGLWSDEANWQNLVIADGAASSANFSTLDLTANHTVQLDSPRTLNSLSFGDTAIATAASWTVSDGGNAANTLTLAGTAPTITVAALGTGATTTLGAALAGSAGLAKAGAGTLILTKANSLTGGLSLTAGGLQLPAGGSLALDANLALSGLSTLTVAGGTLSTTASAALSSANLVINSGSVTIAGGLTTTSNKDGIIRVTGGTLTTPEIDIFRSSDGTIDYAFGLIVSGGTVTLNSLKLGSVSSNGLCSVEGGILNVTASPVLMGSQSTSGRGAALRVSSGTFTVADTTYGLLMAKVNGTNLNNVVQANFLGGTSTLGKITLGYDDTVTAGSGTVTLNGASAALYLGSGGIVKNGTSGMTTTITFTIGTLGAAANWSTTHPIVLSGTGAKTIRAANEAGDPFDIALGGVLSGASTVPFTKTGDGTLTLSGVNTHAGVITINAGTISVGTIANGGTNSNLGAAALAATNLVISGGTLKYTGPTVSHNRLFSVGTAGAAIDASGTGALTFNSTTAITVSGTGNRTLAFTGSNPDANTFTPPIPNPSSGTTAIAKSGAGTWVFSGAKTYTGATTVTGGTLLVNGSITSAASVTAGTFGGSGSSNAAVTVGTGSGPGATLAPGNAAIGTFTTTGALTLAADATYQLQFNSTAGTCDKVVANGVTLSSAALALTDLGANAALAAGASFTIVDNTGASAVAGTFLNLPQGGTVTSGANTFRISYTGGTGNDIVLTVIVAPAITSATTAGATVGSAFSYAITASNAPVSFNATGLPAGLSIDTATGVISGTPTAAGTSEITLSATNAAGTGTATLALTVSAYVPPAPTITSATTAAATVGTAFSYQIVAGNSPTGYNAANLPAGLTVDADTGVISGTPTAAGVTTVTLSATNAGGTGTATLTLTVTFATPVITSAATASGAAGSPFTYTITADNVPATFNATGLPDGLSINSATGVISGTPAAPGTSAVTLSATNPGGTGTATLTLTVNPPVPVITSATTATTPQGSRFGYAIKATNSPASFNATGLPAGFSVNSATGVITGTPTAAGVTTVTLSATNAGGTGTATLTLTVAGAAPDFTSDFRASVPVNTAFTFALKASNSPTAFNATGLPTGLTVSTGTGVISGTPTVAGIYRVAITATNAAGTASDFLILAVTKLSYYVSPTGNDNNAGTLAAPFATIAKAQTTATAGDVVYLRGGTYSSFTIASSDSNYNYVHVLSKAGITYQAYPGETPVFNFSSVPVNLRACGFRVTGANVIVDGIVVTGVPVGAQKQSECFRIDGSAAIGHFYNTVCRDNAANGFYYTNSSRGSCTNCDAYNNIGITSDSRGNTDGFGAHGNGVIYRYCRAWNNSDDGFDSISSAGANVYDHCWAFFQRAGGDSNGFKVGGFGADASTVPPSPVPVHTVRYCLAANNGSHGLYANHQPGQSAVWTYNSGYANVSANYNMLERYSDMSADVPGYREILHYNLAYSGTTILYDNNPPESVTDNSWTRPGVSAEEADFLSTDWTQMSLPRGPGNNLPFLTFLHLAPDSDLAGLGCFQPPPPAPTGVTANWVNSTRVDLAWTASPGANAYYVKRATASGGPYTTIATRLAGTSYTDATVGAATAYYYQVSAMDHISYDEGVSAESAAIQPAVAVTAVTTDTGRSATDAITSDTTLVLSGAARAGDSVVVTRVGTGTIGTVTASGSGAWSFDYTGTALPQGNHVFQITATPAGGGTAYTSDPFTSTVDTAAPAAPVILSAGSSPLVIAGTTEAFGLVTVTLDGAIAAGSAIASADGHWSVTYASAVSPGPHTFTAIAEDIAGNVSGASSPLAVDTSVTTPAILSALTDAGAVASGALTADKTISLSGTAGAGDTVAVTRIGQGVLGATAADGSGVWTFDYTATPLPEGLSQFTATGTNGAATGSASAPFILYVDSVAPAVSSIVRQTPSAATVTSAVPSVVFRVTFTEPVSGVDAGDFALTVTGTAAGSIAGLSAVSDSVYDVTVDTLAGVGTLRLDLKASGTGIADPTGNAAAGFTGGQTYSRVLSVAGSGTWIGTVSGLWSDAPNWLDATIPNATTHTANFGTVDLTDDIVVHLDSARTVNSLTFGDTDTSTAANWLIDNNGTAANTLTLGGTTPTITVNDLGADAVATISARLAGTGGLTKNGPGTVVFGGANTLTGAWTVLAGAVRLDAGASHTATTVSASSTGSQVIVNGGSFTASGLFTTGSVGAGFTLNSGTGTLSGGLTIATDSGTLRVTGGTFSAGALSITRNSSTVDNYAAGLLFSGGTSTVTTITLGTGNSYGSLAVDGGSLTASGAVVVGFQTTAGRGGYMRVTGGSFTSTDTTNGLVLSRLSGSNANNVASATLSGGVTTVEKLTFGFANTVTAGSGTVNLTGGTLYIGSGGIVKNATAGMVSTMNLVSGTIGAKATWSTTHPLVLAADGSVTLKAASAANAAFNITLSGIISGGGGFTKTGVGNLTLSAVNTYTGPTVVTQGTLLAGVANALPAASAITVAGGSAGTTATLSFTTFSNTIGTLTLGGATPTSAAAVSTSTGTLTLGGDVTYDATNHPLGATLAGNVALGATRTFAIGDSTTAASDLTVSAILSGAGFGLTKTGAGTLTLSAANTFTGPVAINAGTLSVTGSLAAGSTVTIGSGGTLAGTGTVGKAVTLDTGGLLSPAGTATGTLTAASLAWNRGGKLLLDLGTAKDTLAIAGALTKGATGTGAYEIAVTPGTGFAVGTYTLATFGSTTFTGADFTVTGVSPNVGTVQVQGSSLVLTVAVPPFTAWADSYALPADQRGPLANPSGDGLPNLLKFALGLNPTVNGSDGSATGVVTVGGERYPTLAFQRRRALGDVALEVRVSASLDFSTSLGLTEISATDNGDGTDTVVVRSTVPLSSQPRQFFRLTATQP
jgi:autotransporter-associated beta strand protein